MYVQSFLHFWGTHYEAKQRGQQGSELTGEVAKLYMLRWDQKYLGKLKRLGVRHFLYTRYVDDTLILLEEILPGWRFQKATNKLVWSERAELEDQGVPGDQRTFRILSSIADSIDKDIQFEQDTPSAHENKKLPCLDLQLWVEECEGVKQLVHEFYKKPMSHDQVVLRRSALSNQVKCATLFQEGMRRLLNCSPQLPWTVKASHLTDYSRALMISGYNHKYRHDIINGVIQRYRQMVEQMAAGERQWYRDRDMIQQQKTAKGGLSAATWHLNQELGITQTLFMAITPQSELTRLLREKIGVFKGPDDGRTTAVEQGV